MVCDKDEKEDIYHFILHCTAYKQERSHSTHIQQPYYIQCDEDIIRPFLFDKEDIEEKKELLFAIWKKTIGLISIATTLYFTQCP